MPLVKLLEITVLTAEGNKMKTKKYNEIGFTLTEALATVAIIGGISSIAIPTYLDQKNTACQRYPENIISQLMLQTQTYTDEYRKEAAGWDDLNKISTIMTSNGPATGNSFNWIELPECGYDLRGSRSGNSYLFEAIKSNAVVEISNGGNEIDTDKNRYGISGCINTLTGASDIKRGSHNSSIDNSELTCG